MGIVEVIGLVVVIVNVIWALAFLISKGLSAETIAVMTAAAGIASTLGTLWVKRRKEPERVDPDGGQ